MNLQKILPKKSSKAGNTHGTTVRAQSQNFQQTLHNLTFESQWEYIRSILDTASVKNRPQIDGMSLYWSVYALCITKPSPFDSQLYVALESLLVQKAGQSKQRIIESHNLLEAYDDEWMNYTTFVKIVTTTFAYLDRIIVNENQKLENLSKRLSIGRLAMHSWKQAVLRCTKMHHDNLLVTAFVSAINEQRIALSNPKSAGKSSTNAHCKVFVDSCIQHGALEDISLYQEEIESVYRQECIAYYNRVLIDPLVMALSLAQYLIQCSLWLNAERQLLQTYMRPSSFASIFSWIQERLVKSRETDMINSFARLLETHSKQDLKNIHSLFCGTTNGSGTLADIFEKFIVRNGLSNAKTIFLDGRFLDNLFGKFISLKVDSARIITECFNNDSHFHTAMDKSFRRMLNEKIELTNSTLVYVPDQLHCWLQTLITRSNPLLSDAEIGNFFEIFRYVQDKESFIQQYSYMLANRLISRPLTSTTHQADQKIVFKLKEMCGLEYTSKLLKMLTDVLNCPTFKNPTVKPLILTRNAWPTYQLQSELNAVIEENFTASDNEHLKRFETSYCSSHQGRKLAWYHSLGTVTIAFGKAVLTLPLIHYLVLRRFERATLSIDDLEKLTKFPVEILKTVLHDLQHHMVLMPCLTGTPTITCAKDQPATRKKPEPRQGNNTQSYFLALNSNQQKTISIPLPTSLYFAPETKPKGIPATNTVEESAWSNEDKRALLQSVIVRLVKKHRTILHNTLVDQVLQECCRINPNFQQPPPIQLVKQTIEQLLEKQYIERDPSRNDCYLYVA